MNKERPEGPTPDPDRWESLARYVAGECTPAEANEIRLWLGADPARSELLSSLDTSLQTLSAGEPAPVDVETALLRVKARMREPQVLELRPKVAERSSRGWSRTLIRAAAAVIVVLGVSVIWRSAQKGPGGAGTIATAQVYTSPMGQLDSVQLSDGTRVLLAPESRLVVSKDFGRQARVVELNGEAYFDVKHDANRPFTVIADAATIRDIGTAFVVRNTADQSVRVAVTSGSVVLHASTKTEQQGVVLLAGDRGVLDPQGNAIAQRGRVTDEDIAFTSGRLVFDDATLDEVSNQLKRWFGIELRVVGDHLRGRHITASFDGESAQQVLNVIGLTLGANIELNGDTAVIRSSR